MIAADVLHKWINNDVTVDNHIKWNSWVDTDKWAASLGCATDRSYPYVTYEPSPEVRKAINDIIDRRVEALTKREPKTTNTEPKKETKMNNTIKNVLFLAPGYNYAKTVVTNQSKELDRKKIPYNASTEPQNFFIHTERVHIEIVYMDPIKWTPNLFQKRDAVFGKKELIDKACETFFQYIIAPKKSLSRYIKELHAEAFHEEPVKPREIYIPEINNAYFNNPMTVVIWEDGTKTMVRCQEGDVYSAETGLALCIAKKALGNMPNFNNVFRKWIPEIDETTEIPITFEMNATNIATEAINRLSDSIGKFAKRGRIIRD
jgi:hypothetical protein